MLDALNKVLKEVFSWILQLIVTVLLNREVVLLKTRRGDERQQAKANNSFTRLCIEDHSVMVTLSKLIVRDVVTENCEDWPSQGTHIGYNPPIVPSQWPLLATCSASLRTLFSEAVKISTGDWANCWHVCHWVHTRASPMEGWKFFCFCLQLFIIDECLIFSIYFHKSCFDFVLLLRYNTAIIFSSINEDWFMQWSN